MPNCGLNPNAFWLIAIDGERVLWGTFRVMNVIRFLLISAVDNITYCYSLCPVVRVGESRYTELAGGWNKWETCFLRHLGLSPVCIQILDLGIFLACYIKKKKKSPNNFSETQFTCRMIYPFEMYRPVAFDLLTSTCTDHHGQVRSTFTTSQRSHTLFSYHLLTLPQV